MLRCVVDPGVLIAALISPDGAPAKVLRSSADGELEIVTCPHLIAELEGVLLRPKFRRYVTKTEAREFAHLVERTSLSVDDLPPLPGVTPAPKDDYLVALARSTGARVIISGDSDLTELDLTDVAVLTPAKLIAAIQ